MTEWYKTSEDNLPPLDISVLGLYKPEGRKQIVAVVYLKEAQEEDLFLFEDLAFRYGMYEINGIKMLWYAIYPPENEESYEQFYFHCYSIPVFVPDYWIDIPEIKLEKAIKIKKQNRFNLMEIE